MSAESDIEFHLVAFAPNRVADHIDFNPAILEGLSYDLLEEDRKKDAAWIADRVSSFQPDVVVLPGWLHRPYMRLVRDPRLQNAAFVMSMDTPWRATVRQRMARFALKSYLKHIDCVMVCGERAWQFARNLGMPEKKIHRGAYSVDTERLKSIYAQRMEQPGGWPHSFLFVGRYIDVKGIDVLIEGYRQYRNSRSKPWPLHCCGMGPQGDLLRNSEGMVDEGFVQPTELPKMLAQHGVFVLPSRFDPWPLAIVEACASGIPVLCTEACGSAVENVRPYYNGLIIPSGEAASLGDALSWFHDHADELPVLGQRGRGFAEAYSPQMWVRRWKAAFEKVRR